MADDYEPTIDAESNQPKRGDDEPRAPLHSVPRRIGNYLIKSPIASGGMGSVYKAVQEQPRRTVALELFLPVCAAVHHGHAKGVIHRDLKPDNILVDSHGRVKIRWQAGVVSIKTRRGESSRT